MSEKLKKYGGRFLMAVAGALICLAYLKSILIGMDIDESYAVAMGYRLVRGDRLVRDMWEPHQFSAVFAALFTAPYVWLRGNTDYLVIYLRVVSVLIHSALGVLLYRMLRKQEGSRVGYCILCLHLLFLPKWVQSLEFELLHYWFLLGIFLVLYRYFTEQKVRGGMPFLGGICLTGCILCYPTMILLYPFYVLGIFLLERQYRKEKGWRAWRGCLLFSLGALFSGLLLLGWILKGLSWRELPRYLSYILMDTSHNAYTMAEKWSMYLAQAGAQMGTYILCLAVAAVLCGLCSLICRIPAGKEKKLLSVMLTAAVFLHVGAVYGFLFGDENQFYCQGRYLALIFPALFLILRYRRRMALWFHLCILPALLSVPAVLAVTNMNTNITYAKAFLGVLGSFLVLEEYVRMLSEEGISVRVFPVLQYAAAAVAIGALLVCRLLLIRVSGCPSVTILAPMEKLESGPAAGIFVLQDTAEIWNDNYRILKERIGAGDRLLYIGAENLVYAATDAAVVTPSTQGTAVFNEMFLYYYQEHPESLPNVIVFDRSYAEDPASYLSYSASLQSGVFFDWLREYCEDGVIEETDHLIIVRLGRVSTLSKNDSFFQ